jgi:DNA helicase IV
VAVFIDEYQDFSEQQVLLMAFRARPKYRQITVAGDPSQRLHRDGMSDIVTALPFADGSIRSIFLDVNHRQSRPLSVFSNCIRKLTERISIAEVTAAQAPLTVFRARGEFAEVAIKRIAKLPGEATVAVICPDQEKASSWYDLMKDGLDGFFRNPVLSERARLTERFKTHFTTSLDAKGLEFDVVVVPDVSEFSEDDPIEINGLYVAVSRPRYALMLGCPEERSQAGVIGQLVESGHFRRDSIT